MYFSRAVLDQSEGQRFRLLALFFDCCRIALSRQLNRAVRHIFFAHKYWNCQQQRCDYYNRLRLGTALPVWCSRLALRVRSAFRRGTLDSSELAATLNDVPIG